MNFPLYFDFYSFGSLIGVLMTGAVSLFFLTLKGGSRGSRFLGLSFFAIMMMDVAYLYATTLYHPDGALHRWATVFFVFLSEIFTILVFFNFPYTLYKKVQRIILLIGFVFTAAVTAYFIHVTLQSGVVFHYDGGYYDFDADEISEAIGIMILSGLGFITVAAIWRILREKGAERMGVVLMIVSLYVVVLIPAIVNALSRQGLLDRELFQILWSLFTVLGLFMLTIVYINYTTDKTPFMVKLIGISFVTFLVIMQMVAYVVLGYKEKDFDKIQVTNGNAFISGGQVFNFRPSYVLHLQNPKEDKIDFKMQYDLDLQKLDLNPKKVNYFKKIFKPSDLIQSYFAYLYDKLYSMAKTKNFVLPKQSYGVFQGYYNQLFEWSQGKEISEKFIEQSFRKMYNWMRYYRKKLEKYQKQQKHFAQKEVKWNQKIQKVLRKLKGRFPAFYKAIEGQPLQNQILMMQPVHSMQDRLYRGNVTDHYIGYVFVFKGNIYEIGLPYTEYRKFMHDPTLAMIWILMGASFVILFGFRFFFAGTLVNPLNRLLEGVSKVNEGNLNVSVKVGVEDEIGFLTRSFNDMVISIRTAQEKLQEYANSLEEKVKERTLELQKTLEEVQALKVQQDGDYFLTSRLINPLGRNNATGEFTKVEFIVKQKKHFQFRKWEAEIGGDICMAHTLYLDDEKYIFFLNADAMGKSIQGAGGALVLGAVMESIIQRTNLSKEARHTSPEKWLYYTFIELQKVFESFDGAMLISMIMGLVHDQSGFLYFLNAEHPWAVLYRDGRSEFLENELAIRKVGFMGAEFNFSIKTFSMAKGDAIFLGSDGKDDLVLPNGTVNEDETLFLRVLNEAKGELEKIPEVLQKHGKLMDDLSVMKITWEGKEPLKHLPEEDQKKLRRAKKLVKIGEYEQALSIFKALHAQYPDADFIVHDIVYTFSQKQDYAQMAGYAIYGMRVFPADEELMYKASYASKMAGDYNTAADIGERLRLRNPTHFRNLINVANVHLLLGNLDRATQLLEEAKAIDPENPKIEELMQAIEKLYPDT